MYSSPHITRRTCSMTSRQCRNCRRVGVLGSTVSAAGWSVEASGCAGDSLRFHRTGQGMSARGKSSRRRRLRASTSTVGGANLLLEHFPHDVDHLVYGISRVLGKWRSDHASTKADAEKGHHAREGAKLLRSSHGVQKARAMRLAVEAIEKRSRDGIGSEVLNQINGEEICGGCGGAFRLQRQS
jgi:hypothetical protein